MSDFAGDDPATGASAEAGRPARIVVRTGAAAFQAYDLEGPVQPEMAWLPLSYRKEDGRGAYLMRMEAGAVTIEHTHPGRYRRRLGRQASVVSETHPEPPREP